MRAFGQRCPGPTKVYGFVGKTVGHPPCGNFSPRWALAGRHGSLMVSPGPECAGSPCLCRVYPNTLVVPGGCLAALLAAPAGWQPLVGYPLVLEALTWGAARPLLAC